MQNGNIILAEKSLIYMFINKDFFSFTIRALLTLLDLYHFIGKLLLVQQLFINLVFMFLFYDNPF